MAHLLAAGPVLAAPAACCVHSVLDGKIIPFIKSPAMKKRSRNYKPFALPASRWAAYATAGAASAIAAAPSAEGSIHYSGNVGSVFALRGTSIGSVDRLLPLSAGASLACHFYGNLFTAYYNVASFRVAGAASEGIRGIPFGGGFFSFASRLQKGDRVSRGNFVAHGDLNTHDRSSGGGPWAEPGTGYVGFKFNTGRGIQYGWIRLRCRGNRSAQPYSYVVEDYAWGDPGDNIKAGQTQDNQTPAAVPDKGSLGWLALGGAGLSAWRRGRKSGPSFLAD